MAWIKVEHITPDKPEIVSMAEALKIDQDAVFGKCMRLWIWADQQTVSGDDLSVTPSFIDRLTNCAGFSQGLLKVGWLKGRGGRFLLPNFVRHNGQTAKNRALSADRMQRQRYAKSVTKTAPDLESEKEIEEEKKRKRGRGVLAHVDPGNLPPAKPDPGNLQATRETLRGFLAPSLEEVRAHCAERGNRVDPEKFIAHYTSNGWRVGRNPMKSWKAAIITWERNDHGNAGTGQRGTFGTAGKAEGATAERRAAKTEGEFPESLSL